MNDKERIAELEGALKADAERLDTAAKRAGIAYMGCDTPEALADYIEELEAEEAALLANFGELRDRWTAAEDRLNIVEAENQRLREAGDYMAAEIMYGWECAPPMITLEMQQAADAWREALETKND